MSETESKPMALITGATSGFGQVIAKYLVQKGYHLIILARSEEKANALKSSIQQEDPNAQINTVLCNLSSLASVASACDEIKKQTDHLDLIVLNAGIWNFEYIATQDQIEETFQVNLLAPVLMLFKLNKAGLIAEKAKIILTSSGLHQGKMHYDDLEFKNNFSGFKAYRQSKRGIILITHVLSRLPEFAKYHLYCVHPGMVNTKLGRSAGWLSRQIFLLMGQSIENGAKTHLYLIDTPAENLTSGAFYTKSKVATPIAEKNKNEESAPLLATLKTYLQPYL